MGVTLPKPEGQQQDVVYLRSEGHCVALGSAGSGKTVMAVNRAAYLAEAPGIAGPTLLVTFNGALVVYLKSLLAKTLKVDVRQYHVFARACVAERTGSEPRVCDHEPRARLIERAIEDVRRAAASRHGVLTRPPAFFVDEFDWLAGQGEENLRAYGGGDLARKGRAGTSLTVADRQGVLRVYERYRELLTAGGYDQDWPGIAGELRRVLETGDGEPPYRHVVIDEGQDFSPEMIRSLVAAVPPDGSVTFFGDYAQQLYGRRVSWRSLGLRVQGRGVVRFDRNYRNTREITRVAAHISELPYFAGDADLVRAGEPTRTKITPTLVRAGTKAGQIAEAARYANNLVYDRDSRTITRRVAVLLRTQAFRTELSRTLPKGSVWLDKRIKDWESRPGVFYGLYADFRGLEFDSVILPLCDDDEVPSRDAVGDLEAMARQARELYIGVTRARTDLVILYSGRLTELLPGADSGLYELLEPS